MSGLDELVNVLGCEFPSDPVERNNILEDAARRLAVAEAMYTAAREIRNRRGTLVGNDSDSAVFDIFENALGKWESIRP